MRIFLLLFMVSFSFSLMANESCVKEILEEQDISGIINSYDINYKRDLLTTC